MAAKKTAAAAIDPERSYRVELAAVVRVGRSFVLPGARPILKGDVLTQVLADTPDSIVSYSAA